MDLVISPDVLGISIAITSITIAVTILFTSGRYVVTGRRKWSRRYKWIERIWITFFISAAGLMWTDVGRDVPVHWMTPALLPWIASVLVRGNVARTRILVVRREFKPQRQLKLMRSKEESIDYKIGRLTGDLRQRIRDGRIVLSNLDRGEFDLFRRLGLDGVRLNVKAEGKRLAAEHHARQIKEHERMQQERKRQNRRERKLRQTRSSHGVNNDQRRSD